MQQSVQDKSNAFICIEGKNGFNDFAANLALSVKVVLIFGGETRVWIENRGAELASAGDAIIIFPNQRYRFETQKNEDYIYLAVDIMRISELLGVISSRTPISSIIKGAANDAELLLLAKNAVRAYSENKSSYRDTVIKGYVTALLGKLFSMAELKENRIDAAERHDTLSEIVGYCNSHFREKLSLTVLERELHISKYYISHIINERLGEGFNEYINSIRINEACKLLRESEKSIKEISAEVGFGTVRSFDRAFASKKGETAREYRKRNTEISKKD
jgi:AraC-like DNA-binding protein